jgi:hypothetical protein
MTDVTWIVVAEVPGLPQAELLASILEANGVEASLSQESYAHTLGLTVGPMSRVQIFVNAENLETAQQIVDDYFAAFQEDSSEDESEHQSAHDDSEEPKG